MNERIGASFRIQLLATLACGVLVIVVALVLISRDEIPPFVYLLVFGRANARSVP